MIYKKCDHNEKIKSTQNNNAKTNQRGGEEEEEEGNLK